VLKRKVQLAFGSAIVILLVESIRKDEPTYYDLGRV
jgi:hypothetical protein